MAAANAGGKSLTIAMHGDAPEIVVPTVGVSISSLATYLQRFLGYSLRTTVAGEIIAKDQRLTLLLRLNGQTIFRSRDAVAMDSLDDAWQQAAEAVMLEISPYRAALALYDTNPDAAIKLAYSIIRRYPRADENVAWARLLRGSRNLDLLQYAAAEKEFRAVLQQVGAATMMPPWMPFAPSVSYAEPAQFYLGLTQLSRGDFKAARVELNKAIRLDPKATPKIYRIACGDASRNFGAGDSGAGKYFRRLSG